LDYNKYNSRICYLCWYQIPKKTLILNLLIKNKREWIIHKFRRKAKAPKRGALNGNHRVKFNNHENLKAITYENLKLLIFSEKVGHTMLFFQGWPFQTSSRMDWNRSYLDETFKVRCFFYVSNSSHHNKVSISVILPFIKKVLPIKSIPLL